MKKKDGFVYIWYDRKHKRYYVGSHWGSEDDGYVCSSTHMKRAYKRRSQDFKRRILKRLHECTYSELLEEEFKWLAMIKNSELSKKYYNQHKNSKHWASLDNSKTIGQKISESHKKNPNWGQWNKGKKLSEETKQKLREANFKQFQDPEQVELRRKKSIELWQDPEYRQLQVSKKVGIKRKPMTKETKLKISKAKKANISDLFGQKN